MSAWWWAILAAGWLWLLTLVALFLRWAGQRRHEGDRLAPGAGHDANYTLRRGSGSPQLPPAPGPEWWDRYEQELNQP
jgi:hypothetical protein